MLIGVRYFAAIPSAVLLLIGYLMAAFTERRQTLHDLMCDTLVVDRYAYTEHWEQQQDGLDAVTIAILVLFGVFMLGMLMLFGLAVGLSRRARRRALPSFILPFPTNS